MRALAGWLILALLAGCTGQAAVATPAPSDLFPSLHYASLADVVRRAVTVHVDAPTSRDILGSATADVLALMRRRAFSFDDLAVPTYSGDTEDDIVRAKAILGQVRARIPSVTEPELEDLMITAVLAALHDCGSGYVSRQSPTLAATGYAGIGADLMDPGPETGGLPWVRVVYPGGTAERAGIRDGDRIKSLNGRSVAGFSARDVAPLIRGPEGTEIDVTVIGSSSDSRTYRLQRAAVQTPAVLSRVLDGQIGYVTPIAPLGRDRTPEVRTVVDVWNEAGIKGWILDLRGGGGGSIEAGKHFVSAFIASGPLWIEASRGSQTEVQADGSAAPAQRALAVLVDARTDSVVLLMASALKERSRARVFGERTVGGCTENGQPQSVVSGGTVYLTTNRMLSLNASKPIRDVTIDEPAHRAADGADLPLAAALAWLQRQNP